MKSEEEEKIFTRELIKTIIFVTAIVVFVRFFVVQPFVVKGNSMEPNFHDNEYLFVDEISYRFSQPERGDVVVFKYPEESCSDFVNSNFFNRIFLQGPCTNFIKRIVGLPGETVIIKNGTVTIKNSDNPSGKVLNESYIPSGEEFRLSGDLTRTLSEDEYFVLGDNRQPNASSDSRMWGSLPKNHIIGKAWLQILPLDELGAIKHPSY